MTGFQSTTTESLGLLVPASVSPMVPAVSSHARRQRHIEAPKIWNFPVIVRRFSGVPGDLGWSEIVAGDVRNQFQVVARHKSGGINGNENRSKPRFSELNRWRSGQFPATTTAGIRRSASKLQMGTKHGRWGGRNRKNSSGQSCGFGSRIRVNGSKFLSLSLSLGFSLSNAISVPVITFCSFFFSLI